MPKIPPNRTVFCFRNDREFTHACGQVFRMSDGPGPSWDACWGYGPAKGGPNWPDWGTPSAKRLGQRLEKHLAKLAAKAAS